MLQIGSPKIKLITDKINGQTYDAITYEVVKSSGLTINVKHDGESDEKVKAVLKKVFAEIPELRNAYTNFQYIDENGRIL